MTAARRAQVIVPDALLQRVLFHLLPEAGYEPALCPALRPALDALRRRRPAVLLVDGGLSRQEPPVLLHQLAAQAAALEVPVIRLPASLGRLQDAGLATALTRSFLAATLPPAAGRLPWHGHAPALPLGTLD